MSLTCETRYINGKGDWSVLGLRSGEPEGKRRWGEEAETCRLTGANSREAVIDYFSWRAGFDFFFEIFVECLELLHTLPQLFGPPFDDPAQLCNLFGRQDILPDRRFFSGKSSFRRPGGTVPGSGQG